MNASHRRVHLVDIENLAGQPRPDRNQVRAIRQNYLDATNPGPDDHIVIACNHGACLEVGLAWPNARLLVRSGTDGADQALLSVVSDEGIERRFGAVVIASGDGIFADAAARLAGDGLQVVVVSHPDALSRRLRLAAQQICFLSSPEFDQEAA